MHEPEVNQDPQPAAAAPEESAEPRPSGGEAASGGVEEELAAPEPERAPGGDEAGGAGGGGEAEPPAPEAESAAGGDEAGGAGGETATEVSEPEAVAPEPLFIPEEAVDEVQLKAVIEAIVYVTEEPVTASQIAAVLNRPEAQVRRLLEALADDYATPERGLMVREVAGGYKMATKPEHHEALRAFAKSLKPPLKLSLAALETLATIAYKQPITAPEIMEIRGVQGAGVLKTLLDRKLIQTAGRKNVVGKPILYRTTKEFLVQFGLKDLSELPTLKEFEDLRRLATSDEPQAEAPPAES